MLFSFCISLGLHYFCQKFGVIKRLSHIIRIVLWTLIGFIAGLYILLRIPAVQNYLGDVAANMLSEKIGSKVEVGRLDIGLNRITMDDVQIYDQKSHKMIGATRLSAKVEILPLLKGEVSISSAQVFGMKMNLYRQTPSSPLNCQYALDSLRSKKEEPSQLNLSIRSLIVRNGMVRYDCLSAPQKDTFDPAHLYLTDLSGHFILSQLTNDNIDLSVKKLSFKEQSGLNLCSMSFELTADKQKAKVKELQMALPNTTLELNDVTVNYQQKGDGINYSGNIAPSVIQPSDFSFLQSSLTDYTSPVNLSAKFEGNKDLINVAGLNISSTDYQIQVQSDLSWRNGETPSLDAHITQASFHAGSTLEILRDMGMKATIPVQLEKLGSTSFQGDLHSSPRAFIGKGELTTEAGTADMSFEHDGNSFASHIKTEAFNMTGLLADIPLGVVSADMQVNGSWPFSQDMSLTAKGTINHIDYDGHQFNNVDINGTYQHKQFDGMLSMESPDGDISFNGMVNMNGQPLTAKMEAQVRHFSPSTFGLKSQMPGNSYDFDVIADIKGNHLKDLSGTADIRNFTMKSADKEFSFHNFSLYANHVGGTDVWRLRSDFANIDAEGKFDPFTLPQSLAHIIGDQLPASPFKKTATISSPQNKLSLTANIYDSEWLKELFNINLDLAEPLHLTADIDDTGKSIDLYCDAPDITYNGKRYIDGNVDMRTTSDTLFADMRVKQQKDNGKTLDLDIHATASDNDVRSRLAFNNHGGARGLEGELDANTQFFQNEAGQWTAHVKVHESDIHIGKTSWTVQPSDIVYSKEQLIIDHFSLQNGEQDISIGGMIRPHHPDTIMINLKEVDLKYMSSILNVKNVEFGGSATGIGYLTSVYENPTAKMDLHVEHFTFADGTFGNLDTELSWKKSDNKLCFDAFCDNGPGSNTKIDGDINLASSELNLDIKPNGTIIDFLEKYCGSFLCDVEAQVYGHLKLIGTFKQPNIEGQVVANGNVGLKSLYTTYTMRNDTITLTPDHIYFNNDTLTDKHGHLALLNGQVNHQHFSRWTFDLNVHADNLLAYDHQDFDGNTFCGTVYGTGDCQISGRSGEVVIDINATPEKNTVFYYNVSSPDALKKQEFIHWNDVTEARKEFTARDVIPEDDLNDTPEPVYNLPSNLHMNMLINATPDATLRLLMNAESGDYISLNGSGVLKANYFNKGAFNIYGNYEVEGGTYKMTIQNLIKKEFQFQPGGTISFGGDPYDAPLDLQAMYTVNGVSLSDLSIGNRFTSNNVRVNCLMNIKGTANAPSVDFDMEMPTISSDAQQMVRSLINSEEELNQQVIYLLTIGRFYAQDNTTMNEGAQSQTSLAMQSLLSGTISQQINSVLNSFINNNNWNFGANISTGDEGWNNAEYEGLLSGRLLNNRLLINGQFGYRDNANATTSFIGDFDVRYLLFPNGNLAVRVYNQTNDRYFTKNSLNTQGLGLIMKKDFNGWRDLIGRKSKEKKKPKPSKNK